MIGLLGAAAIGLLVGVSLEQDTKDRIADDIKKTFFKMQTGKDYKPAQWKPVSERVTTYSSYYNKKKEKTPEQDEVWKKALKFEDTSKALEFVDELKKFAAQFGTVTVYDLCSLRGKEFSVGYAWDSYGWTERMIANESAVAFGTIYLPSPVSLK